MEPLGMKLKLFVGFKNNPPGHHTGKAWTFFMKKPSQRINKITPNKTSVSTLLFTVI